MDASAHPLNLFQRLMRQWDHLHPYNAAQILKLTGQADPARLRQTWQETLSTLQLVPSNSFTILATDHSLTNFLSNQLNTPFANTESPFRPFLLQQNDHHYAGVIYHHYAADSVSIRMLLREWLLHTHAPDLARHAPFKHATRGYHSPLGPDRANWSPGGALLSTLRWAARNRHVARVDHKGYADFTCRFDLHDLGPDLLAPLLTYTRRHRATLNDLFLAVTAQVCDRHVPIHKSLRRPNLALGTIVDLRPYARCDLSDTFGLHLGFTSTTCTPPDLANFPQLLQAIARQSKSDKQTRVPLFSPIRMLAGLAVGKIYHPKKLIEFYRKRLPLAGGISNINLNRAWPAKFHPHPLLDYIRVSPTGPMMPAVFTPTTLGQNLNLGLTYRPSLIPPDRAQQMAEHFVNRLRLLAEQV
jgi:hypothetical protein